MKNRMLSIFALSILVFSSLGVVGLNQNNDKITIAEKSDVVSFSDLQIQAQDDYLTIDFSQASTYTNTPGEPMLPVCVKTYKFPLGSKIFDVQVTFSDAKQQIISSKIKPAPQPVPLTSLESSVSEKTVEDPIVYTSTQTYPQKTFDYNIGVGLDGLERAIFVTVRLYPVSYVPSENKIYYSQESAVKISYTPGESFLPSNKTYDMVIVTPRKFALNLLLFKNHKNNIGVQTKIVTTESIYFNYKGRDRQEDIKLFIKDAIEKWNITYVLLVGAREHNLGINWNVPARYSNLEDRGGWNDSYVTDLYFSDVYKYNSTSQQVEFEDWDSNGNGVFAEWKWTWNPDGYWTWPITSLDVMDLYPDVYIGRLACKDTGEVRTVARKIINYENNAYGKTWFKSMVVGGGDTVPYGDGIPEGEYETNYAAVRMEALGYNVTRLYTSTGNLTSSKDTIVNVSKGEGFLYLSGHGSPIVWSTHPFENESWIDALWNDEMNNLRNRGKYPITVVGGCHNSQFDVAPINMIRGILQLGGKYFTWIDDQNVFGKLAFLPRCWSWNLVRQRAGGSIATIGNTGLGWGVGGEGCIEGEDGFITSHFFVTYINLVNQIGAQNVTLGMAHSGNLKLYIDTFHPNDDEIDRKTVEEWVLLGDPSLRIGGVPD